MTAIDEATPNRGGLIPKNATLIGLLGHAGEGIARKGFDFAAQSAGDRVRQELAAALTQTGPRAQVTAADLARALAGYRSDGSAINQTISNPALAAAILASEGGRRDNRSPPQ